MTWKIREASAIFVLLVAVTTVQSSCDTSMADTITPSLLSGTMYFALRTSPSSILEAVKQFGMVFTTERRNNEDWISMDMFYTRDNMEPNHCGKGGNSKCKITDDKGCLVHNTPFFVMAHDDNYLVFYAPTSGDPDTLSIYARNFDQDGTLTVGDLSVTLLENIKERCGDQYGDQSAYTRQFPPGNFIPQCETFESP